METENVTIDISPDGLSTVRAAARLDRLIEVGAIAVIALVSALLVIGY